MENSWVERIHTRLLARYGTSWVSMWAGIDMGIVMADWVETLDGVTSAGIRHALERLPLDRPPNAAQFRVLCISKPAADLPALDAPKANPAVAAQALASLKRPAALDSKAWAWHLKRAEETGARLTMAQRDMWRAALRRELEAAQ
jgi:hypothetical protein